MQKPGPTLESMLRRLVDIPADFLEAPRTGPGGMLHVAAVVYDLVRMHAGMLPEATLARFASGDSREERNRLALILIASWLLADDWWLAARLSPEQILSVLDDAVPALASGTAARGAARLTPASKFVTDADRREELVRVVLARIGYRPEGETEAQAADRLSAISSLERERLMRETRAAEKRAREIRAALVKKAAEESADKWTRE